MSIQYCNFSFLDLEKLRGFFISIITCVNYYFSFYYCIFLFVCLFSHIIVINYFKTLPKYLQFLHCGTRFLFIYIITRSWLIIVQNGLK